MVRTDGAEITGKIVNWTPVAVSIQTNGVTLEIPAANVGKVTIDGADGCEEQTARVRYHLMEEEFEEAAQALVDALSGGASCPALGRLAFEILDLPKGTLPEKTVQDVVSLGSRYPEVNQAAMSGRYPLDRAVMIDAGRNALLNAEGEEFVRAHTALLKLYQAQLRDAIESNDRKTTNESLIAIAQLYTRDRQKVKDAATYQKNLDRNVVDRMGHAVQIIPLPADFRQSASSIEQLRSLAQSGMQSAQDQVKARLEEYFVIQGRRIGQSLVDSGDYEGYQAALAKWRQMLPSEIAESVAIVELSADLDRYAEREGIAWDEYTRLKQMADAGDSSFAEEIDAQILRFERSFVWTDQRVEQMRAAKGRIQGAAAMPVEGEEGAAEVPAAETASGGA
ncbi:MAG: hypothetical protein RLY93_07385 [Sumerlaeia bacterium]